MSDFIEISVTRPSLWEVYRVQTGRTLATVGSRKEAAEQAAAYNGVLGYMAYASRPCAVLIDFKLA